MKQQLFKIFLFIFVLHHPFVQADPMELEVIPLNSRLADEVIPILRPLVVPGGTITGMNNQLIIKTTPENLAEIKSVLQSLDRPPRRLLITVKQDIDSNIERHEDALSGKYSTGNVTISSKDPGHSKDGLVIRGEDEDGNHVQYRTLNRETYANDRNAFRVQALEGKPAFISSGQSLPIHSETAYVRPDGVIVRGTTEYHDASSGFYVLPRLSGDLVTLLVAPRLTRVQPGATPIFDVQSVETTASGRLGEWIHIGNINQNFNSNSNENFSAASSRGSETGSVLIRVDELK